MKFTSSPAKLIYLGILSIVLSLPACKSISKVQFQAMEAPQVILPTDVTRLAFVDRNQHFPVDSIAQYYIVRNRSIKDTLDRTQNMPLNCYQGFTENISEFWTQDSIPFLRLPRRMMPDTVKHYTPLSWERVERICKVTESDVLVVLEDIQAFNKYNIEEGELYWALTEVNYYGFWRIYDPVYRKIYGEKMVVDSLFLEDSDSNFDRLIKHKIPKREVLLNDASYELGRTYVELISPKWVDIRRNYFNSGDKRMSAAVYFMNRNQFDSAINVWESLTKEGDLKLAGRAAYNMAVVYEMKGDLKNARNWIRKAIYFYKKMENRPNEYKEVEAYALILNSRWVNGEKIKRFFGEDQ